MQGGREDLSHLFVEVVQCAVARLDSTEQEVAIGSVVSGLAHIELLHRGPHAPAHVKGKRGSGPGRLSVNAYGVTAG